MPREDYDKFIQIAEHELPSNLRLFGVDNIEHYECLFIKVHDINTTLIHRDYSSNTEGAYIYLRIFDDRIEILNPGDLYGNNRLENLGTDNMLEVRNNTIIRLLEETTDIVEKEMYSFVDSLNGDELTMRPENTASVVRACIEHNLLYDAPRRLWYMGPMFRHERPQRGRLRQFHQFGLEALGFKGPDVDAEQLLLVKRVWDKLGIKNVWLELNCLGQFAERQVYRETLIKYFEAHKEILDEEAQRRLLYQSVKEILDTKEPGNAGVG